MNLVRLQPKGSGSDLEPYTVIVTLNEDFAGQLVTMSQESQKTLTKVCPTVEPYEVTFKPMYSGVWVVSSTTIDGNVSSEPTDNLLEWGTYTVTLKSGFDFEEWLIRGRVEETYESLDEVLADEKTIRQLFTVHDSVDYLVEVLATDTETANTILSNDLCAKWINLRDYALDTLWGNEKVKAIMDEIDKYGYGEWVLMPQVPKMTSNTSPIGSASGTFDNDAWALFNPSNDCGSSKMGSSSPYVTFNFNNPLIIKGISIASNGARTNYKPWHIEVYGSNDGNFNSEPIASLVGKNNIAHELFTFDNNTTYKYYRVVVVDAYSGTSTTEKSTNYCNIDNLQFYAWQPKGNVPVMTSNNAPYGTASTEGNPYVGSAYNAFNGVLDNYVMGVGNTRELILDYSFTTPTCVKSFSVTAGQRTAGVCGLKKFKIVGSNDKFTNDVHELGSFTGEQVLTPQFFKLDDNTDYYLSYRIYCYEGTYSTTYYTPCIAELQYYGRELKVSVPKMDGDNSPWGEVKYATVYAGEAAYPTYGCFDGNRNTKYLPSPNTLAKDYYIEYDFPKAMLLKAISLICGTHNQTYRMKVVGYDEELEQWVDASLESDFVNSDTGNIGVMYLMDSICSKAYRKYRLICTYTNAESMHKSQAYGFQLFELQFYGVDYSEREFEQDPNMKFIYDHGVEWGEINLRGQAKRESDYISTVQKTSSEDYTGAFTSVNISTEQQLMRMIVGKNVASGYKNISVSSMRVMSSATATAAKRDVLFTDLPNDAYLDISNYNGEYPIAIFDHGSGYLLGVDITEWWLE